MLKKIGYINKDSHGLRVYSTDGESAQLTSQGGGLGSKNRIICSSFKILRTQPEKLSRKKFIYCGFSKYRGDNA